MSRLTEAIAAEMRPIGGICSVRRLLDAPPEGVTGDEIASCLADWSIPSDTLARALRRLGAEISGQSIQRHRRRLCLCRE